MHSAGLEHTKLTYTRLEDNLIRHQGESHESLSHVDVVEIGHSQSVATET